MSGRYYVFQLRLFFHLFLLLFEIFCCTNYLIFKKEKGFRYATVEF